MWEDDNEGFAACFLVKKGEPFLFESIKCVLINIIWYFIIIVIEDGSKTRQGRRGYLEEGAWDAIHVIEVNSLCMDD